MTIRDTFLTALVLFASAMLSACGSTGKTSRFVLDLDLDYYPRANYQVRIASAAMEKNAAYLQTVNVRPWGKFGSDDLRNLEYSLRNTIKPHFSATLRTPKSRLDIHLLIRRYVVGISNTAGAVLVSVAWAATSSDGRLIFQEQFYAAGSIYLVGTIGGLKDTVHRAIVRRIATTSMVLAVDPVFIGPLPLQLENTSASLEEAISRLPGTMVSLGAPHLASSSEPFYMIIGLLTPSEVTTIQWEVAKPSEIFDWHGYLEKLYP